MPTSLLFSSLLVKLGVYHHQDGQNVYGAPAVSALFAVYDSIPPPTLCSTFSLITHAVGAVLIELVPLLTYMCMMVQHTTNSSPKTLLSLDHDKITGNFHLRLFRCGSLITPWVSSRDQYSLHIVHNQRKQPPLPIEERCVGYNLASRAA